MKKTVVIACDHAGFELKDTVRTTAESLGWNVVDAGTCSAASVDFPDFAQLGAETILRGDADVGIFMCGSGVGVSLAASKIPGIYACVCHDTYSAHQGVEHDGMNVLCLGARIIGSELCKELVKAFLGAEFNNQPNQIRRFNKIRRIEAGDMYLADRLINLESAGQSLYLRCDRQDDIAALSGQIADNRVRGVLMTLSAVCDCACARTALMNRAFPMRMHRRTPAQLFAETAAAAVRKAAALLQPVFNESGGQDGLVLVEYAVESFDQPAQAAEDIRQFWKAANRPNLVIAIPASGSGLKIAEELLHEGVNVAFTAVAAEPGFISAAQTVLEALEDRFAGGKAIDTLISGVIFEADRIDGEISNGSAAGAALPLARRLAAAAEKFAQSERWSDLREHGARPFRIVWSAAASTGIRYQNSLVVKNSVAAMTSAQIAAYRENGRFNTLTPDADAKIFPGKSLEEEASLIAAISRKLEETKGNDMIQAYLAMQNDIQKAGDAVEKALGVLAEPISANFKKIEEDSVITRIFAKDPTVWTFDTQAYPEIRNRLGWLDIHKTIEKNAPEYREILESLRKDGITKALLIGMGGSSLAPEVVALTFADADGLKLTIIDSTDPGQVLDADQAHPLSETVYIVSSKSGGTAEIRALMDYFYAKAKAELGDDAGKHFIAITDPGTLLERTAAELRFRKIVISDPSIGGRFSVLSPFGILPAVLIGLDPARIERKVSEIAKISAPSAPLGANESAALGVFLGTAAQSGRDKITILTDRAFASFGSWLEQLIAESSGKNGRGIVPIDIEPELPAEKYGKDRAFVYVDSAGEKTRFVDALIAAGQPVLTIRLNDSYDIFREFYRWELAVSVACAMLGVNAFDQPNVQDSKTRTVAKVNDFKKNGKLDELSAVWRGEGVEAYFNFEDPEMQAAKTVREFIAAALKLAKAGEDYVAINAYIPRSDETLAQLQAFREKILKTTNCATTLGFGPRFQHSTGQLHKGGANNGVFLQLVADAPRDAEIPGEGMSFATFERAQALGDFEALLAMDRRAIRLNLGKAPLTVL